MLSSSQLKALSESLAHLTEIKNIMSSLIRFGESVIKYFNPDPPEILVRRGNPPPPGPRSAATSIASRLGSIVLLCSDIGLVEANFSEFFMKLFAAPEWSQLFRFICDAYSHVFGTLFTAGSVGESELSWQDYRNLIAMLEQILLFIGTFFIFMPPVFFVYICLVWFGPTIINPWEEEEPWTKPDLNWEDEK